MRRALCLAVLLVFASGCRKKTAPEYYGLESNYSILVARDGDDAYADPQMDAVVEGLKRIGPNTVEGPKAEALLKAIADERARILAEAKAREEQAAAAATAPPIPTAPTLFPTTREEEADAGAPVVDAGRPTRPYPGMSQEEFSKAFGACFSAGPNKALTGLEGLHPTQMVNDDAQCRKDFGSADPDTQVFYVFGPNGLAGQVSEQHKKVPPPPPPKEAAAPDAGTTYLLLPGAPLPPGYTGVPGAPPGVPGAPPGEVK